MNGLILYANANGQEFDLPVGAGNSALAGSPATNVRVVFTLSEGLIVVTYTPPVGSYDSVLKRWTMGTLGVNTRHDSTVRVRVTEIGKAPLYFTYTVYTDSVDANISDNTVTHTIYSTVVATPDSEPAMVTAGANPDIYQGSRFNVSANDFKCTGNAYTKWKLAPIGSEIDEVEVTVAGHPENGDILYFSEETGIGYFRHTNPYLPGKFYYQIECTKNNTTTVFGIATVVNFPALLNPGQMQNDLYTNYTIRGAGTEADPLSTTSLVQSLTANGILDANKRVILVDASSAPVDISPAGLNGLVNNNGDEDDPTVTAIATTSWLIYVKKKAAENEVNFTVTGTDGIWTNGVKVQSVPLVNVDAAITLTYIGGGEYIVT